MGVLGTPSREGEGLRCPWRMSVPIPSARGVSLGSCDQGGSGVGGAHSLPAQTQRSSHWDTGWLSPGTGGRGSGLAEPPPRSHPVPPTQGTGLSIQPCAESPTPLPQPGTKGRGRSPLQRETEARGVPRGSAPGAATSDVQSPEQPRPHGMPVTTLPGAAHRPRRARSRFWRDRDSQGFF